MRVTRDGSFVRSVVTNKAFKLLLFVAVIEQAIFSSVSSMPQRSNVFFPSTTSQNAIKNPNDNHNGIVQILTPPDGNGNPSNSFINNNGNPNSNFNNNGNPSNNLNNNGNPNSNFNNNNGFLGVEPSEFQVGTTGIECNRPGSFVMAPDGCNRCFCAENRQLSSACSRALCPPGFPSSNQGQFSVQ